MCSPKHSPCMNLPEATVAAVIDAELTDVMHVKMLCMSFLCIKLSTCTGFPPELSASTDICMRKGTILR